MSVVPVSKGGGDALEVTRTATILAMGDNSDLVI